MEKEIEIPGYPAIDSYTASPDGRVFKNDIEVNYHKTGGDGARFVRLSGGGKTISMNVAKLVLLAFDKDGYKEGMMAIRLDGNTHNDSLNNLIWGTRSTCGQVAASLDPERFKNLHKHKKDYKEIDRDMIRDLWKKGRDYKYIMEKTGASVATVYKYIPQNQIS